MKSEKVQTEPEVTLTFSKNETNHLYWSVWLTMREIDRQLKSDKKSVADKAELKQSYFEIVPLLSRLSEEMRKLDLPSFTTLLAEAVAQRNGKSR